MPMIFDRLLNSPPGIEPHVTLHHVDHPQILEDEYGGWLSLNMVYVFLSCSRAFYQRNLL